MAQEANEVTKEHETDPNTWDIWLVYFIEWYKYVRIKSIRVTCLRSKWSYKRKLKNGVHETDPNICDIGLIVLLDVGEVCRLGIFALSSSKWIGEI